MTHALPVLCLFLWLCAGSVAEEVIRTGLDAPTVDSRSAPPTLVDFSDESAQSQITSHQGSLSWQDGSLIYRLPANQGGSFTIRPAGEPWDLSDFNRIVLDMAATQGREIKLKVVAKNPDSADWKNCAISFLYLDEGQRQTKPLYLIRSREAADLYPELSVFESMHGLPGGFYHHWLNVDPGNLIEMTVSVIAKPYPQELRLLSIRASHPIVPDVLMEKGEGFFPFIDSYGQYRHDTWPGKIESDEDLRDSFAREQQDLADHPTPSDRSQWGGWRDGPRLQATGFFRTEKHHGQWWLVDPDGHLFWSHGVTGVGVGGAVTRVIDREHYFTLPDPSSELAAFHTDKGFNFTGANLFRALGPDWSQQYLDLAHRRLASWGMNTLGMWSQPDAMMMRRTPYTVAIHCGFSSIGEKLPDPFDPGYRVKLRQSLERHAQTAGDPWCIGYFVDNELKWGKPMDVLQRVVTGSPRMAAKIRFVSELRQREDSIDALNARLGSNFADWDAFLQNDQPLDLKPITEECERFYRLLCETFFETCRDEVKRLAPNQLYLGCRFNNHNPIVMEAAVRYCDVISYNLYEWDIRDKHWPGAEDKPFISSEFHFGAQDRGMWGLGLRWASDQGDRAKLYRDYVRGALQNPNCVGTHWFQYNSQAFTGRGDGENYQVGLNDIGGRPYPELRDAVREVGRDLYPWRSHTGTKP